MYSSIYLVDNSIVISVCSYQGYRCPFDVVIIRVACSMCFYFCFSTIYIIILHSLCYIWEHQKAMLTHSHTHSKDTTNKMEWLHIFLYNSDRKNNNIILTWMPQIGRSHGMFIVPFFLIITIFAASTINCISSQLYLIVIRIDTGILNILHACVCWGIAITIRITIIWC